MNVLAFLQDGACLLACMMVGSSQNTMKYPSNVDAVGSQTTKRKTASPA
jgi:hypothetical protein